MNRTAAVMVLGLLAGCDTTPGDGETPATQIVDTTNSDALDGMSSQEVQSQAEALTPEQAAARGLAVDSSIHIENLSSQDTAPAAAATPAAQPGRTGTVPPAKGDTAPPTP